LELTTRARFVTPARLDRNRREHLGQGPAVNPVKACQRSIATWTYLGSISIA